MNDKPNLNYGRPAVIGFVALVVLAGGSFFWASNAQISGAVIASGSIVVAGKPQSIQHLDGGIVKKIHIATGDTVENNQILIELDDTSIAANFSIYKTRLRDSLVRKERLLAELNNKSVFKAPTEIALDLDLGDMTASIEQQLALLKARRLTRESELEQLNEKVAQFENQIVGVNGLIVEKKTQIKSYGDEIDSVRSLVEKGLTPRTRLIVLERSKSDMRGQIAEHLAEISRVQNSISETRIAKLQVDRVFREKVVSEVEQSEIKISELRQQVVATGKQLARAIIRAPVAGIVHELNLFTIGGVVSPGQVLLQIIRQSGNHEIELSVDTRAIDQVYIDQAATVRFPAFHQRTTPELKGNVTRISPTSVVDEKTGQAFYRIVVGVSDKEMERLGGKKLVPGMPVEAFIATDQRTVMSYLIKPLQDQFNHVFRER